MAETKLVTKVKKKWFTVLAPENFGKKEISDISAVSAESAVSKIIDVPGQMLTGTPRDMNKKYKLRLTEAVGDKIQTKPIAYYLADSFVQRTARRYKERFLCVTKVVTKDNSNLIAKLYFLNVRKLHHSERGALIAKTKEWLAQEVKTIDYANLFDVVVLEKLTNDLRKVLTDVYSVDKILLTKLNLA